MTGVTDSLAACVAWLEQGGVVAAATESFFGLLADIGQASAVEQLFGLKPRGADKGVPILLPSQTAWPELVAGPIPGLARAFADARWPGGLSIALPAAPWIEARVAREGTIAVRLPGESPAAEIARRVGRPLSATSANLPGQPPATRSSEVEAVFADALTEGRLLVLRGDSPGGAPSTVVSVSGNEYRVDRAAAVPTSVLDAVAREYLGAP